MKIYFARSIRGASDTSIQEIPEKIMQFGEVLSENFDYSMDTSRDKKIFLNDVQLLQSCNVFIAEVSNPSFGVGYEIGLALQLNKPVLCIAAEGVPVSAMVTGNHAVKFERYASIDGALTKIQSVIREYQ